MDRLLETTSADVGDLLASTGAAADVPAIDVTRHGDGRVAASAFDVDRLLGSAAAFAAGGLAALDGTLVDRRPIDLDHLVAWCTSTVAVDGEPLPAWADLSGVYPTADGRHLQLHCNFAHHAAGVVDHLAVPAEREALAAAIAERRGEELEAELIERGMIAALIRSLDQWDAHPHARATRDLPIVTIEPLGDAPPQPVPAVADLRVVDQTRVLAGPVAGQLFASAGCDVMRVGAAHLPSVDIGVVSTGFGKRNAHLDLRTPTGRAAIDELLRGADVWLDSYRPGSLAALGVTPERAADLRPGIVVVQINAFDAAADTNGPWAGRRGYDSIVQSTTGLRWAGGEFAVDVDGRPLEPTPRGLPVQALDFATGFIAAGVATALLLRRRDEGGSWLARVSLRRTRDLLVGFGGPSRYVPRAPSVDPDLLDAVDAPVGLVEAVRPFAGRWTGPPRPLGSSPPRW